MKNAEASRGREHRGNLIAIDPGRITGWAVFKDGQLRKAETVSKTDALKIPVLMLSQVLIETPRWYPRDQVDTNDLIDLAVYVGELKENFRIRSCAVELVWPRTWKGNVPKDVMTKRILDKLTPAELEVVPVRPRAKTPDHNAVDAIGLGLWKFGRLR